MGNNKCLFVSEKDLEAAEEETISYDVSLTGDDLRPVPWIKSVTSLTVYLTAYEADNGFEVNMELEGSAVYKSYDGKEKEKEFSSSDFLTISTIPEDSDIEDVKGRMDFLPAVKACFYAAIPAKEKGEKAKKGKGYTLMTEAEYAKKHAKKEETQRPFANIGKKIK